METILETKDYNQIHRDNIDQEMDRDIARMAEELCIDENQARLMYGLPQKAYSYYGDKLPVYK